MPTAMKRISHPLDGERIAEGTRKELLVSSL